MKYWIKNGLLLLNDKNGFLVKKEDLFVDGSKIVSVGIDGIDNSELYTVIDADMQLIMPGLINSHTHAYMSILRNSADDLPLHQWLQNRIFPLEARMTGSDFYWSTLLACMEMIKTGTTCFMDMHICENECAKAVHDSHMRAYIGKCITGNDLYNDTGFEKALREKDAYENELLQFVLSPHSVYACSQKLLLQIAEESAKRNMLKHIHLSESDKEVADCFASFGKSPVKFLHDIGFLDNRTIAAHCVKVHDDDIALLAADGVNVVTNPSSNAKLGNGIAPVVKMLDNGVNVCLGTDSAASNNTLNMFREMGFFSLIHKAFCLSSSCLSAHEVLKCSTVNAAHAFGMCGRLGIIDQNASADLVFVDLNAVSLSPNNDIVSALCYSANGSEVRSVMINGNFVMKNGVFTTIDSERVLYEANQISNKIIG